MHRLKLLNSLAFRNLIRQKRRNLLLGIAIAFGTMILILANSFSRGITDTLLNKVVVQMTGHLELAVLERSRAQNLLIRDRAFFLDLLQKNLPDIREISENVAVFSRAIGNGKGENVIVVPVELGDNADPSVSTDAEYLLSRATDGKIEDLLGTKYENPVAIFSDKAKSLNVRMLDTIKMRLKTVSGQEQSARFTVVMMLKSESLFESGAILLPLKNLKRLRGLRANETGSLQVTFKKFDSPRAVTRLADKIHNLLKPGIAAISGEISKGKKTSALTIIGLAQDYQNTIVAKNYLKVTRGAFPKDKDVDQLLITETLADNLGAKPGETVKIRFKSIHESEPVEYAFKVAGVFPAVLDLPDVHAILPEAGFYRMYLGDLPAKRYYDNTLRISEDWKKVVAREYKVLPRTATGDDLMKKNQELRKTNFYGPAIDVRTMYESASQVLELESALNRITVIAVIILFFIILIGVINTLRMTIRERTREIGTMRAIGVQRADVRNIFLLETFQLAFFSAMGGLLLALLAMGILSSFTIETQSVLGLFLSKHRLYFLPLTVDILKNIALILVISTATAYFPSRRAAKLDAAAALRHYE
jgi:ABC-type lipoprotein release transport system permease subunit